MQYGAQEGFLNGAAIREPNAWFNVNYYLAANPDLLAGGVTAPTALDHFLTYGISENREFSATLSLSEFTAAKYASENKDLREAFDIADDFTELTAEQKTALITHYLSYGYAEDRKGAGAEFEKVVTAKNEITVKAADTLSQGTIVDDEFTVTITPDTKVTIDGLGGNDTVVFNNAAAVTDVTLKNIEEVVAKGAGAVTFTSAQLLNKITLDKDATGVTANFANNLVSGSADELNVVNKAANGTLTVKGFEVVNLTATGAVFALNANAAKGASLAVNVDGGKADVVSALTVQSENSPALDTLTIDTSAYLGNLTVNVGDEFDATQNVVIKGGAGKGVFNNSATAAAKTNFTVEGGAGDETFNASKAIDTFTGGAGKDTFVFTTAANAKVYTEVVDSKPVIKGIDTIVDFKKGENTLKLAATVDKLTVVEFTTSDTPAGTTLEDLLGKADVVNNTIFDFGGDAYVVLVNAGNPAGVENAQVIKLAGVQTTDFKVVAGEITGGTGANAGEFLLA